MEIKLGIATPLSRESTGRFSQQEAMLGGLRAYYVIVASIMDLALCASCISLAIQYSVCRIARVKQLSTSSRRRSFACSTLLWMLSSIHPCPRSPSRFFLVTNVRHRCYERAGVRHYQQRSLQVRLCVHIGGMQHHCIYTLRLSRPPQIMSCRQSDA